MNRFLIPILAGSLSILSAAEYIPNSPTQEYQRNFERIDEKLHLIKEKRASIFARLALLDHSDHRDLNKPESSDLIAFKAQKQLNRQKYAQELKKLKKDLKKLSKEKKRLESTQDF